MLMIQSRIKRITADERYLYIDEIYKYLYAAHIAQKYTFPYSLSCKNETDVFAIELMMNLLSEKGQRIPRMNVSRTTFLFSDRKCDHEYSF